MKKDYLVISDEGPNSELVVSTTLSGESVKEVLDQMSTFFPDKRVLSVILLDYNSYNKLGWEKFIKMKKEYQDAVRNSLISYPDEKGE